MRYKADQKAKAKVAILQTGAQVLRKRGFNGIGMDGLAAAAGVTSGALYSNFANKEAILEGVIETCLGEPFIDTEAGTSAGRREKLREWLAVYLSDYHRRNPEVGCVMPTLSADVARASDSVRQTYDVRMEVLLHKMMSVVDGGTEDRKRRAWSIIALMVGAVSVASAMPDGDNAESVLRAALETASALIG
jgi:TetR/AcrR family transcriptional repressor of nem operon